MSRYCRICGFENPRENETLTLFEGKILCDCKNGNKKGRKVTIESKKKRYVANPFDLYEGEEYEKSSRSFNRKFKKLWKTFTEDISKIRGVHREVGADDTASIEEQIKWINKRIERGDLI